MSDNPRMNDIQLEAILDDVEELDSDVPMQESSEWVFESDEPMSFMTEKGVWEK